MAKLTQNVVDAPKYTPPPPEKTIQAPKAPTGLSGPATPDRPYACPYQGCEKAYIHEYKLNLHLRREHPAHFPQENSNKNNNQQTNNGNEMDGNISDQDGYAEKLKVQKQNRAKPNIKLPPSKAKVHQRKSSAAAAVNLNVVKKAWQPKEEMYEEEDSEETEEERDNVGDGWRYGENNEEDDDDDDDDDDEETEYED